MEEEAVLVSAVDSTEVEDEVALVVTAEASKAAVVVAVALPAAMFQTRRCPNQRSTRSWWSK